MILEIRNLPAPYPMIVKIAVQKYQGLPFPLFRIKQFRIRQRQTAIDQTDSPFTFITCLPQSDNRQ